MFIRTLGCVCINDPFDFTHRRLSIFFMFYTQQKSFLLLIQKFTSYIKELINCLVKCDAMELCTNFALMCICKQILVDFKAIIFSFVFSSRVDTFLCLSASFFVALQQIKFLHNILKYSHCLKME